MTSPVRRNLRLLAWFNFCCDLRLYGPIAILYFAQVAGSYARGGAVLAIAMGASAALELPTGMLSDRIGRRLTVVAGAVSSVLAVTIYGLATSFLALAAAAVLEGLARAFYSGNNEALLYETLHAEGGSSNFGEELGRTSSAFQFAAAISALLAGPLAASSLRAVVALSIIPQLASLAIAWSLLEPPRSARPAETYAEQLAAAARLFLQNRRLRLVSLAGMIGFALGEAGYQFRAAFVAGIWPLWAVGLTRILSSLAAALSFRFSGRLIRRASEAGCLLTGTLYGSLVEAVGTAWPTFASPAIMSSGSLFFGVATVSKSALMQREFSEHHRATMGSLQSIASSASFAAAALAIGAIADRVGPARALLAAAIVGFPTALLYLPLLPRRADPGG